MKPEQYDINRGLAFAVVHEAFKDCLQELPRQEKEPLIAALAKFQDLRKGRQVTFWEASKIFAIICDTLSE